MSLDRLVLGLLFAAGSLFGGGASADVGKAPALSRVVSVRVWTPNSGADDLVSAQASLAQAAPQMQPGAHPEFRTSPRQPVWLALDLAVDPNAGPWVLELTHPSIRAADLYLSHADGAPVVVRGGRDTPMAARANTRFPATLALPADMTGGTVYLRLKSTVPMRGQFLLQPRAEWKSQSRGQLAAMTACFSVAVLAVLFAMGRAWRLRSRAYGLYALLGLSIGVTGMFISGYGESWLWPGLADWRGPIASAMACVSAGLALLLAQGAFALEVRAPRFALLLRVTGVLCPLAGVLGLAFDLAVHQILSHGAAAAAIGMSLSSFWFAWRTENRAAVWLLLGFVPVSLGVGVTTLAVAGVIPFTLWVLMAMPLGSALEVPFNLYGLHLLEQRRALVLASRAELDRVSAPAAEPRHAMLRRLSGQSGDQGQATGLGLLMLLRFPALAPGSPRLRILDAVDVEHFLHSMMVSAVRPGNHVGRRSFHEIVLRNPLDVSDAAVRGLLTALFAQALRSDRFGIEPRDAVLRIAYGRLDTALLSIEGALDRLVDALDDAARSGARRIEVDLNAPGVALRQIKVAE